MAVVCTTDDTSAEIRHIVETGFTRLQEWLDSRLERQEILLLRRLGTVIEIADSTAPASRHAQKVTFGEQFVSGPDSQLRIAGICTASDRELSQEPDAMSGTSIEEEVTKLPGSVSSETCSVAQSRSITANTNTAWTVPKHLVPDPRESYSMTTSTTSLPMEAQDWQSKLMDVFDQLDLDRSGSIDRSEITEALKEVGMPNLKAFDVFTSMDTGNDGYINRMEWLQIIEQTARSGEEHIQPVLQFLDRLAKRQAKRGLIYETDRSRKTCLIIRHHSPFRMAWDMLLMALLSYISLTMPFQLGFGEVDVLQTIDLIIDILFCIDVCLNFRTTYVDNESIVVDGKLIAWKYLTSWFLLDFFSSVPFDLITAGILPSLTPARLLKIGRIAKVMKLLRISKLLSLLANSEMVERIDEICTSRAHQTCIRICRLSCTGFVVAHWLACFGAAVDKRSLEVYFANLDKPEEPNLQQRYLAAIYWAMSTLTTVGYGDITPESDEERLYAMLAMVIGGSLYGYVIGAVTSMVTDMDLNTRAYLEKMELYQSWLDSHAEIPYSLRRLIRKHFKKVLAAKAAVDDSIVIHDLSNELRGDTALFIVHECVRHHPMFAGMKKSELSKLVEVLQTTHISTKEYVVRMGDPGTAMYILVEGAARYDEGVMFTQGKGKGLPLTRFQQVGRGDSFGEEILFGMEETYTYTIIAIVESEFHTISEDGFHERYQNMPELQGYMRKSYFQARGFEE